MTPKAEDQLVLKGHHIGHFYSSKCLLRSSTTKIPVQNQPTSIDSGMSEMWKMIQRFRVPSIRMFVCQSCPFNGQTEMVIGIDLTTLKSNFYHKRARNANLFFHY